MRIKCVSSNVGTVDVPGCGAETFSANQIYDLPEEFALAVLRRYPKFFKRLDDPTLKVTKQSYTDQVKVKIGFDNSAYDPDDVNFN